MISIQHLPLFTRFLYSFGFQHRQDHFILSKNILITLNYIRYYLYSMTFVINMNYFNVIMTNDAFLVTNEKKEGHPDGSPQP